MAFRANRLRIQLPCGPSGSIIDITEIGDLTGLGSCDAGCSDSPQSAVCPPLPPPPPPPPPSCGVPSHFDTFDPTDIYDPLLDGVALPKVQEHLVLDAADLPVLKRELEMKLKMAEFAQDVSARAREQVEAQLREVALAEQHLAELPPDE
jgi:hypothetical protein